MTNLDKLVPVEAANVKKLVFKVLVMDEETLVIVPVGLSLLELVQQPQGQ